MRTHARDLREVDLLTRIKGAEKALAFLKADPARADSQAMHRLQAELETAQQERMRLSLSPKTPSFTSEAGH